MPARKTLPGWQKHSRKIDPIGRNFIIGTVLLTNTSLLFFSMTLGIKTKAAGAAKVFSLCSPFL